MTDRYRQRPADEPSLVEDAPDVEYDPDPESLTA
jgi:hypothetical protein